MEIQLEGSDAISPNILFLVTSDNMEMPISRFNMIKEMLLDDQQKDTLLNILIKVFGN